MYGNYKMHILYLSQCYSATHITWASHEVIVAHTEAARFFYFTKVLSAKQHSVHILYRHTVIALFESDSVISSVPAAYSNTVTHFSSPATLFAP